MINTLDDYIRCSMPQWGDFTTNPNLRKKVDDEGKLLPFLGNTVVFLLDDDTKQNLRQLQESLYRAAPDMLAEPLQISTFHMTLHDLVNAPEMSDDLKWRMKVAEEKAKSILEQWRGQAPLHMKATWLFNMVNTSIVLGLAPADEDSWRRLDEMYMALEEVVPLGYALTPHITMAYFKPGIYAQEELRSMRNAQRPVELDVELRMDALVYQEFFDMNHYENR